MGNEAWELAEICREGVNGGVYGGEAPHDSNALSETWPTVKGAGFTTEYRGRTYCVIVTAEQVASDLIMPHR